MVKPSQQTSNYGVSKSERELLAIVRENDLIVFSPRDVSRLLGCKKSRVHNILQQLKKKGIVANPRRNHYVLNELFPQRKFEMATGLTNPSYISFWTCLNYYGFTEQQVKSVQVVTTKNYKNIQDFKIQVTRFKPDRFFGYLKEDGFSIAEKEKCLIDSFAYPEKAGGFNEVMDCLKKAWAEMDREKFQKYLRMYGNKALNARLGYLLEKLELEKLTLPLPTTYVKLNKEKDKAGKRIKKWRIVINDEI